MSIMITISLIISIVLLLASYILNKRPLGQEKLSQYECGFEPAYSGIGTPGIETRERFYIKFYIIGIIFLVFDLEAILLYPFTTIVYPVLNEGINIIVPFTVFLFFIIVLLLGLIYEYKKGVL